MKAKYCLSSSFIATWWYPDNKSMATNQLLDDFTWAITRAGVGNMLVSGITASLSFLKSVTKRNLVSSLFFGTQCAGEQNVIFLPCALSMIPSRKSFLTSLSIYGRQCIGVGRGFLQIYG